MANKEWRIVHFVGGPWDGRWGWVSDIDSIPVPATQAPRIGIGEFGLPQYCHACYYKIRREGNRREGFRNVARWEALYGNG